MKLQKPKNTYSFAVLLLIENYTAGVSPVTYTKEHFHKFPWRVRDVARAHPKLTYLNNTTTRKNRFDSISTFKTIVPTCNIAYLKNLYLKLNREGLKPIISE
jgi:hypothetical protein